MEGVGSRRMASMDHLPMRDTTMSRIRRSDTMRSNSSSNRTRKGTLAACRRKRMESIRYDASCQYSYINPAMTHTLYAATCLAVFWFWRVADAVLYQPCRA